MHGWNLFNLNFHIVATTKTQNALKDLGLNNFFKEYRIWNRYETRREFFNHCQLLCFNYACRHFYHCRILKIRYWFFNIGSYASKVHPSLRPLYKVWEVVQHRWFRRLNTGSTDKSNLCWIPPVSYQWPLRGFAAQD